MSKKEELNVKIDTSWKLYYLSKRSLEIVKYISENNDKSPFWSHIYEISIRSAFIEIDKLVSESDNQKYNLIKILNSLKPSGHYRSLKVDEEKINQFINGFKLHEKAIKEIKRLRDGFYAHTDNSDNILGSVNIHYNEITKLLTHISNIIQFLKEAVIGRTPILSIDIKSEDLNIFSRLREHTEMKNKELRKTLGKKNNA